MPNLVFLRHTILKQDAVQRINQEERCLEPPVGNLTKFEQGWLGEDAIRQYHYQQTPLSADVQEKLKKMTPEQRDKYEARRAKIENSRAQKRFVKRA